MANNPSPREISPAIWYLWEKIHAHDASIKLGGIFAPKSGYHDIRANLNSRDYSLAEVAEDRKGPGYASAIDLTPATRETMIGLTTNLDRAARAGDPRLWMDDVPVMREFIGTLNGKDPYCWVFKGGRSRGLPHDQGPDWGRDSSHLWHLHLSFIRMFCDSRAAMDRLFSVLSGQPLNEWLEDNLIPQDEEDDMGAVDLLVNGNMPTGMSKTHSGGKERAKVFRMIQETQEKIADLSAKLDKLTEAVSKLGTPDTK